MLLISELISKPVHVKHTASKHILTPAGCDFFNTSTPLSLSSGDTVGFKKPQRVCLYSPTAVALLECAKQVGKLQLHSLIFFLLVGRWEGVLREVVPACLPACLPLVEWNPRIVRDHTGS